jgi:transcriptional regulator with XRE-family HTH domain
MTDSPLTLQRLGKTIKVSRENRGLTQASMAALAGVTRLAVIKAESGHASLAIGTYSKIVSSLGSELVLQQRTRPTLEELQQHQL